MRISIQNYGFLGRRVSIATFTRLVLTIVDMATISIDCRLSYNLLEIKGVVGAFHLD
jgi:hypothetical protein